MPDTSAGLNTQCVTTLKEMRLLAADWDGLLQRAERGRVFLSYEWMAAWCEQWGSRQRPWIVTVRDAEEHLVALAPFVIADSDLTWMGARALRWMGAEFAAPEHLTMLVEAAFRETAVTTIAEFLVDRRDHWDYIELADTDHDCPAISRLRAELSRLGLREKARPGCLCPYTELPGRFADYLRELSSSMRYNFGRRCRKLSDAGRVEVEILTDSGLEEGFDELVRLHRERRGSRDSSFLDPQLLAFHRALLARMGRRGWVRLLLLRCDGRTVAALYGFSFSRRFSFYQCGMDPAWAPFSVGLVMMGRSIEAAIDHGHLEFDFLRGDETYKFHWAKQSRTTLLLRFFDHRPRSRWAEMRIELARHKSRLRSAASRILKPETKTGEN